MHQGQHEELFSVLSNFIFLKHLNSPVIQSILLLCPPSPSFFCLPLDKMSWASAQRDCEVWMLHRDTRSCGGNHLVLCCFISIPCSEVKLPQVLWLHASLSPCQTRLAGTARGDSQLLLLRVQRGWQISAGIAGDGKRWQGQEQPQEQLVGPGCHCCHWLLRTQSSGSSLQQTEHRLLASGASSTC